MVSVLIFDLWDTIATSDSISAALSKRYGPQEKGFLKRYEEAIMLEKYDLPELCEQLLVAMDRPVTEEELIFVSEVISTGVRSAHVIQGMPALLSRVSERYRLAILSNNTWYARDVPTTLGLSPYFEKQVYSYQIGAIKPLPAAYAAVCEAMGVDPEDCVMIDDHIENVRGAEAFGMGGIQFEDPKQLEKELQNLGLLG